MRLNLRKDDLIMVFAPIVVGAFLYFLLVPPVYIVASIAGWYGFLLIYPIYYRRTSVDMMKKAWERASSFWYNFRGERLDTLYAKGYRRYFGDAPFYAFKVRRAPKGERAGQWLVIVVDMSGNKPQIADWDDKPDDEKLENPFKDISKYFAGAPSPSVKPELEPLLRVRHKVEKKKKKEGEEEGVEEIAVNEEEV